MRSLALLPCFLVFACSGEEPPPPNLQAMKYTIREIIEKYHEAGDKGEVAKQVSFLDEDVSIRKGGEVFISGRDNVEEELTERADEVQDKPQTTILGKFEIELIGDNAAMCTFIANIENKGRAAVTVILSLSEAGIWKIRHIHDSWPDPAN